MNKIFYFLLILSTALCLEDLDKTSESSDEDLLNLIEPDAEYEPPPSLRIGRNTPRPLGVSGYYRCGAPDGGSGSCKPRATCASYYSTSAHYDYDRPDRYKSCNYGYGYRGVCCPDVYYEGRKPNIIKIHPTKRVGYDGAYSEISPEAIKLAVKYAQDRINRLFKHDEHLGRGEDDDSYWGNGVAQPNYLEEFHDLGWAGYFIVLMTSFLVKEYGYNPAVVYDGVGGLKLDKYLNLLPQEVRLVCQNYNNYTCSYKSKYRTIDGSCNNLAHPYFGQSKTSVGRILVPKYSDGVYGVRKAKDGNFLPPARYLRSHVLPEKDVGERAVNTLYTYYGQFIVHDVSHTPFYQAHDGQFVDCCFGYNGGNQQVSPKCYAVPLPKDDNFYKKHKVDCLNMARNIITPNPHCSAGYASQVNRQTSFHDMSVTYGTTKNESDNLRTGEGGLLKMSKIGNEYMLPLDKDAECFNTSQGFCMTAGDLRATIHPGITVLQTLAARYHNYCAKKIYKLNPKWDDEKIFQECRRIVIAVFQHITYNEYLPLVLGWKFMYDHGLLPTSKGFSYDYSESVNPWVLAEFTGSAFRCHSSVYGQISLVDESYNVVGTEPLQNHYNDPSIFKDPANFEKLVRGYLKAAQRRLDEYYDPSISLYLLKDQRHFGLDIGSFNLNRGRDYALRPYNDYRELCGLPRARNFEDFLDYISPSNVDLLRKYYRDVDDVDLYAAALMEKHQYDSTMGPTWWCLAAQQFKNWKSGDRFFYDLGGQPGSFTLSQLDQIRHMSMAALICTITNLKHVPAFAFHTISNGNPLIACSDYETIPRLQFGPWKDSSYRAKRRR